MEVIVKIKTLSLSAALLTGLTCSQAWAQVAWIDSASLISSTEYYTEMAGLDLGNVAVMTGGGNGANVGDPTGRNDDGFMAVSLGFSFSFYGNSYSSLYANNNGNITFGNGLAAYTPDAMEPLGANLPIIAPFFADADTRNPLSGVMHVNTTVANQAIVTWDSVGYYNQHADLLNSFQLVIRGADYTVPAGEGMIGFFWKTMGWEVGDSSGGSGGFNQSGFGTAAAIGFGDGSSNGLVLDYSMTDGVASVVQNHHIWFNISGGQPVLATAPPPPPAVPEPETYAMLLAGLGWLGFTARRRKQRNA